LARLESGHTPSRYHIEYWGGTIPWIALPDIRALDAKVATATAEYTNDLGIANSAARVLPPGTVVLSRTASVGFVTIMGREMATSQDFVNWVCGPELDPRFLLHVLLAARTYFRGLASGAVHKTVYMPTVMSLHVCIPEVSQQRRLAALLDDWQEWQERSLRANREMLEAVDSLPTALLRQAFNGEL
jgi:type I restriction enzyme S subunit